MSSEHRSPEGPAVMSTPPWPPVASARSQYRQHERDRELRPADLLLEHRIIFLAGEINYGSASDIVMKLLWLQKENRRKDIHFYINSFGGEVDATFAIYDTMQVLSCPVATYCVGQAYSGGSVLLVAGSKGKRFALPHAKVMIHQPQGGTRGQITDIQIQADQYLKARELIIDVYARHTTQDRERIAKDIDRDFYMTAVEAKDYGIVDDILTKQKTEEEQEEEEEEGEKQEKEKQEEKDEKQAKPSEHKA
jgi:ATP-dependent Clp protease protease subunit